MAKKKESSISDIVNVVKDIVKRSKAESFVSNNRVLMGYTNKKMKFYLSFDIAIWNAILDDEELKKMISEFDVSTGTAKDVMGFSYCERPDENFIEINPESMYNGENMNIKIDGYEYDVTINKGIFPVRFKKAEFNNIEYKLYMDKYPVLVLRKRWVNDNIPDSNITILRLFQIV